MPSDYENGAKKTIDISIKAEKMTADVLKSALQEFMSGKAEKKGPGDRVVKRAGARNGCFEGVRSVSDNGGVARCKINLNIRHGDGNGGVLRNESYSAQSRTAE